MATKVFAVPELLESILLELPAKDLLLAQRVDTTFRDAIDHSIKIQRALFFKPDLAASQDVQAEPRINPLLKRILDINCNSPWISLSMTDSPGLTWDSSYKLDGPHLRVQIFAIPKKVGDGSPVTTATGSWQRMMATNPAVPAIIEDDVFCYYTECQEPMPMDGLVAKLKDVLAQMTAWNMERELFAEDDEHAMYPAHSVLEDLDGADDDDHDDYDDPEFDDGADANDPGAMYPSEIGEDEDYLAIEDEEW